MVDFFLPYLPLEEVHIRQLFERRLSEEAIQLRHSFSADLEWGAAEVDFLVSKVVPETARMQMPKPERLLCRFTSAIDLLQCCAMPPAGSDV